MTRPWKVHDPVFASDEVNPGLAVSPWSGHRLFAYDLLAWMRPTTVVELGTHYGCSLFAFAQAVKDLDLPSRLWAVDTWEGDPHAGHYGEEVWDTVVRTLEEHFPGAPVELVRSTFDDALPRFEDGSVELLHIDGFHSYDAVKDDYETWLPKLADGGVVLFHDIAHDTPYESPRFWREVRDLHPGFDFPHSFGLGVLFPKGDGLLRELEEQRVVAWSPLYTERSTARLLRRQLDDTRRQLEERWEVVTRVEQMVRDRDEALAAQAEVLEQRWVLLEEAAAEAASLREEVAARTAERDEMRASLMEEQRHTAALREQLKDLQERLSELRTPIGLARHGAAAVSRRLRPGAERS